MFNLTDFNSPVCVSACLLNVPFYVYLLDLFVCSFVIIESDNKGIYIVIYIVLCLIFKNKYIFAQHCVLWDYILY